MKHSPFSTKTGGFTLVELLVVIAIIGILLALLLPVVQAAREAARRMQCTNHLKQLSLACHNYHSSYGVLPPYAITTNSSPQYGTNWLVLLLPYIEQQAITEMILSGGTAASINGTENFPAGPGRVLTDNMNYRPWQVPFSTKICPSDPNGNQGPGKAVNTTNNVFPGVGCYRACVGDCTATLTDVANNEDRRVRMRGTFMFQRGLKLTSVTDGTSNTFLLSEASTAAEGETNNILTVVAIPAATATLATPDWCMGAVDPNHPKQLADSWSGYDWKGRRWNCVQYPYAAFITVQAPNTPTCVTWRNATDTGGAGNAPIVPTSSYHPGGANHSRADGTVLFVSNTVDIGDSSVTVWHSLDPARPLPGNKVESPFGIYGAMGTASAKESKAL
jgi:prepilin-type N-terminal cleavage/methylation domain-containing protein